MTFRDAQLEDCETVARGICMALHREPEWRGRGVGMRLMQAQIDRARELGFNKAALLVDPENENAKRMYRKLGFVDDSEVYAFGQMFWKWVRMI